MTEALRTPAEIEAALEEATKLDTEDALETLEEARHDLERRHERGDIDADEYRDLETQLEQRIRQVRQRDIYSSGESDENALGSAMNPEDENAP